MGVVVGARIVRAEESGGTFRRQRSDSAPTSPDEAQIGVRMMEDEPPWRNPFPLEPRRRERRLARAHVRARGRDDSGHMGGASGDEASQRSWRAEHQHDHGQGRAAGRVERDGARRWTLNADRHGVVAMRREGREGAVGTSAGSGGRASGDGADAPRRDARYGGAVMRSLTFLHKKRERSAVEA